MTDQVLNDQELVKRLRRFVKANPKRSAGALRRWLEPSIGQREAEFEPLAAHLVVLLDEGAFAALLSVLSSDDASKLTSAIKALNDKVGEVRPLLRAFYKLCEDQQPFELPPDPPPAPVTPSNSVKRHTLPRLRALPYKSLAHVLRQEHPQAAALIIAHLGGELGARVLGTFEPDQQAEICRRITELEPVPPFLLTELEETLITHLGEVDILDESERIEHIAALCTQLPDLGEEALFPELDEADAELAQEIREHMYTFDDLIHIDDRGMQKLIGAVPRRDLVLSLKRSGETVKNKVLKNMSKRAREALLEDLELLAISKERDSEERDLYIFSKSSHTVFYYHIDAV